MRIIDGDVNVFHARVKNFFDIHKWNIEKLANSMFFEYEPLENYHGKEIRKEDITETEGIKVDGTYSEKGSGNTQTVDLVSGYNDVPSPIGNTYHDSEHDRTTGTTSYERSGDNHSDSDRDKNRGEDETITKAGNIGVSYQSLIEEERRQAEYNIYKWIAVHFCRELLVCVW